MLSRRLFGIVPWIPVDLEYQLVLEPSPQLALEEVQVQAKPS